MQNNRRATRRRLNLALLGSTAAVVMPAEWRTPIINSVVTPAHAQTSTPNNLCADGVSTWLMSEYQENGTSFTQGSPQSQVQITITANSIALVTDWYIINSSNSRTSRGRVTDQGTIDLDTGVANTSPTGSPTDSPTHGAVSNLANNLPQSFTLGCADGASFVVRDTGNVYSFRLTRAS